MTESFTKKRVLSSVAVHKRQSVRAFAALALLLACSLQVFRNSVPVNVKDDTVKFLPSPAKNSSISTTTHADELHFMCLS